MTQKLKNDIDALKAGANYRGFWGALLASSLYQTLRAAASDLGANMLVTELISALSDTKLGEPNERLSALQCKELLESLELPGDDVEALYYAKSNGLYELYPIPGFVGLSLLLLSPSPKAYS